MGFALLHHRPSASCEVAGLRDPHGKRILSSCQAKGLREVVCVPAGHAASHGDALLVRLLLQQADREPLQPRNVVRGEPISQPALILAKRDVEAPVQCILDAPMAANGSSKPPNAQPKRADKEPHILACLLAMAAGPNGHADRAQPLPLRSPRPLGAPWRAAKREH